MSEQEPCYHWHPPRWMIAVGSFISGGCLAAAMTFHANIPLAATFAFLGGGLGALLGSSSGGFAHKRSSDNGVSNGS